MVKVSSVLPVVSRRLFLCLIKSFQFYCKVLLQIHQRCFEVFDLVRLFIYISREGLLNLLDGNSILNLTYSDEYIVFLTLYRVLFTKLINKSLLFVFNLYNVRYI